MKHVPVARNTPDAIERRREYCQLASTWEENDLIYIDESGFNLHTNRRLGRSRIGVDALLTNPNSRGGNITLIAAISPQYGMVKFHIKLGSVTSDVYKTFITELLAEARFQLRSHIIV